MGSFLDSAKNIRKDKKSASGKAHQDEEKLAKKEEQGVKMKTDTYIVSYWGKYQEYHGLHLTYKVISANGNLVELCILPYGISAGFVPKEIKSEISDELANGGIEIKPKFVEPILN